MAKKARELTDEQIEQIIQDVREGIAISTVASRAGIGITRIHKWMGTEPAKKGYSYIAAETKLEQKSKDNIALARAYWAKFNKGDVIQALMKRMKRKPILTCGQIVEKKNEYIVIIANGRRTNIPFVDVLAKIIKIRHKASDRDSTGKVLSME